MNERPKRPLLLFGGLVLVLAAGLFIVVALRFFRAGSTALSPPALTFADLPESAIPGRYKWIDGASDHGHESFMELLDDHSFINKDGTIFSNYRWELTSAGLSITWSKSTDLLTNIEAPGVYAGTKANGLPMRMEKQPPSDESEWAPSPRPGLATLIHPTNIVASIRLDDQAETNHLAIVNTGGDGRIFPALAGGVQCHQLIRVANRREALLYVRIASELKEPPFTNAAVLVEYFDARPADRRTAFVSIQYDAPAGAYTPLAQRVRLTGTEKWKQAIFYLDEPLFENRQNSGADFRLYAVNPEFCVRSIKLAKNIP